MNCRSPMLNNVIYRYSSTMSSSFKPGPSPQCYHLDPSYFCAPSQNPSPFFSSLPTFHPTSSTPYSLSSQFCLAPQLYLEDQTHVNYSMSAFCCSRYHRSADGWCQMGRAARTFSKQMNSSFLPGQSKTTYQKSPWGSRNKSQNTRKLKATKWTP